MATPHPSPCSSADPPPPRRTPDRSDEAPGPTSAASTLIYRPASFVTRLAWETVFPVARPVEVELGCGDGGFLARYAAAHPERNYLGVERLLGRLRKLDRKGLRAGLVNLRLIRLEASYLVEYLLPPGSIAALHIYFPDPWPKRRHHKNRLINPRFADLASRVLAPGGGVYVRTDDADYFTQIIRVFAAHAAFDSTETPPVLAGFTTDFEGDFVRDGRVIHRAAFALKHQ